ncbi:MAG: hypothetical protein WBB67_07155 [bacterium]
MRKGGMMKRILVLLGVIILFVACDYAKEGVELKPDIEVVYMNPIGWYTSLGDTTAKADIETIDIVAQNSVDCYLEKVTWEYYDESGNLFFGPDEMAIFSKINGIVDPACVCTTTIENIQLPLLPVWNNIDPGYSARVLLRFIAVDEYFGSRYDTCTVWYGIYMWPQ